MQGTEEALKSFGNANGVIPPNWNRRLELQMLRREAEQLILGLGSKPQKLGFLMLVWVGITMKRHERRIRHSYRH